MPYGTGARGHFHATSTRTHPCATRSAASAARLADDDAAVEEQRQSPRAALETRPPRLELPRFGCETTRKGSLPAHASCAACALPSVEPSSTRTISAESVGARSTAAAIAASTVRPTCSRG